MNEIYLHAKHYRRLGLNVTCMSNRMTEFNFYCKNRLKSPCHKWSHLFDSEQLEQEFEAYPWHEATGVGMVSGYKNLRVIDIDGCSSFEVLYEILEILGLPRSYDWVTQSGSRNGFHIIVRMDKYEFLSETEVVTSYPSLPKFKHLFEKIEILWNTSVVLPPSFHPSSNRYDFLNVKLPSALPNIIDLNNVTSLIKKLVDIKSVYIGNRYGDILVDITVKKIPSNLDEYKLSSDKHSDLFLFVDIETDGLFDLNAGGGKYPNILQIAWLVMDNHGVILKKESHLINSNKITNAAFHINNINIEIVKKIGSDPHEVYSNFMKDLRHINYIIAHNIDFDIPIIENELSTNGFPNIINNLNKICTMKTSTNICKIPSGTSYKFPKLSKLYNFLFGTKFNELHNAESDVLATAICFRKMLNDKLITLD